MQRHPTALPSPTLRAINALYAALPSPALLSSPLPQTTLPAAPDALPTSGPTPPASTTLRRITLLTSSRLPQTGLPILASTTSSPSRTGTSPAAAT